MQDHARYFDILGLKFGVPPEEIVSAYKTLMEYWDPDRVPDFYKQKAMEGRDKIEEAYQVLMGLKKIDQHEAHKPSQTEPEQMEPRQLNVQDERVLLGKDRDEALCYLDKKTIVVNKDRVEIEVDIYPPEESTRFHTAQGYVRRAGYEGLECLVERWGLGLSNGVFVKHATYYRSKCGQLIQAGGDIRKVWKPISPGTLEETAWKEVGGIFQTEKQQRAET
jgi:hypothetical protein